MHYGVHLKNPMPNILCAVLVEFDDATADNIFIPISLSHYRFIMILGPKLLISAQTVLMRSKDTLKKICCRTINTRFSADEKPTPLTNFKSKSFHLHSLNAPGTFWSSAAKTISWISPASETISKKTIEVEGDAFDHYEWFSDGVLNTCFNCVDRHLSTEEGRNRVAIIHESPVTNTLRKMTYRELHEQILHLSNILKHTYQLVKGDRVVIYMPNTPEAVISMLSCARLGIIHSVVFGGFASAELATRISDCQPKLIITTSCGIDGSKVLDYKALVDEAIQIASDRNREVIVPQCLVCQREKKPTTSIVAGRDREWHVEMSKTVGLPDIPCEPLNATDPLYILYTSGTTGQPKGVVRDNGGHAVALRWSMKNIYGINPSDVFWAASDVGWVVGHSFSVYGPLLLGCTTVLYEGKPVGTPDEANFWRVVERHRVTALFTAPTALRAIKRLDEHGSRPAEFDLSSLRTLFLAGERADPDTLKWAERALRAPVRDHWWQTETGWPICANMVGLDGHVPVKYGSTYTACPGYDVQILDDDNQPVPANSFGNIVIKLPMPPGVMTSLFKNDERFVESYLKKVPGYFSTGDAGYIDEDGYVFVMSRTDDVLNVAGHRLSSGAMEEVISDHPDVAEVAVVGVRDTLRGQLPLGLIVLNSHCQRSESAVLEECVKLVREKIGAVACFRRAVVVDRLPKTRSGKTLRATMRSIANGEENYRVPATIEDRSVLDDVKKTILEHSRDEYGGGAGSK